MNNLTTNIPKDLIEAVAKTAGTTDIKAFNDVLMKTIMPGKNAISNEEICAFLMVAKEYNLNPVTKEIYAFLNRGGVQAIVSIDGWLKMINSHPAFDGMEFKDERDSNNNLVSVTCRIYRNDRSHAIEMTEYMNECKGTSEPWKKWPARMLRHKATIQCARYAFGFSGIVDEDEAQRIEKKSSDIVVDEKDLITKQQELEIQSLLSETGSDSEKMMLWVSKQSGSNKTKLSELTQEQFNTCMSSLTKKQPKEAEKKITAEEEISA